MLDAQASEPSSLLDQNRGIGAHVWDVAGSRVTYGRGLALALEGATQVVDDDVGTSRAKQQSVGTAETTARK